MKLQLTKEYLKTRGPPPLISYKASPTFDKTPTYKSNYLRVGIKTQPGNRDSKTVAIYVPLLQTGSPEALLNFVGILNKIIRG